MPGQAKPPESPNLQSPISGIVLAGGASQRIGRDKAFLELGGRPLIAHVVERLASVCAEVLIMAGDTGLYANLGVPVVEDRFHGVGVLGGLHAGLEAATHDLALAVGCDMPFLNPGLLRAFAAWAEGFDAAVLRLESPPLPLRGIPPREAGGETRGEQYVEPLHAAYRRTCLPALEAAIRAGERRVVSFFPCVRVRYVSPAEVALFDPDLRSFRNVNTLHEWEAVQAEWVAGSQDSYALRITHHV